MYRAAEVMGKGHALSEYGMFQILLGTADPLFIQHVKTM